MNICLFITILKIVEATEKLPGFTLGIRFCSAHVKRQVSNHTQVRNTLLTIQKPTCIDPSSMVMSVAQYPTHPLLKIENINSIASLSRVYYTQPKTSAICFN